MGARIDPYSLVGTTVRERYTIVSFGGVGRHSIVYRAIEAETQRPIALRFLKVRPKLAPEERTTLMERLRALVQPMSDLSEHSPALVDVQDVTSLMLSESEGRWMPALVQPWIDGRTLESVLVGERQSGDRKRNVARAIELLSPVADALQYAHARGVVHGSLAPRNLFVRGRRATVPPSLVPTPVSSSRRSSPSDLRASRDEWTTLQILDLGMAACLAELQDKDRPFAEGSPCRFFVPAYGAPEQFAASHGSVGPGADVFALALVVVELVTGVSPMGDGDDDRLEKIATDAVYRPTPKTHGVTLGPYVEAVLERALAVRSADRYATVGSFWDALRSASRVILRADALPSPVPPPLPVIDVSAEAENDAPPVSLPKPPPLPDPSTLRSMIHGRGTSSKEYAGAAAREPGPASHASAVAPLAAGLDRPLRESPAPLRESIPPHEFFAEPVGDHAPEVALEAVARATNPLFRADAGRSVAPSSIDGMAPSQPEPQGRRRRATGNAAAVLGAFLFGVGGACLGTQVLAGSSGAASKTPLSAAVLSAVAAIKLPASPALAACPSGMVRVAGGRFTMGSATDLAAEKPAHEVVVAPYCIDKLEVTAGELASQLDQANHGRHAPGPITNGWTGISPHDHKVYDPLCNARDAHGRANHPANCVDWKAATTYCAARSARLPTEAEWELAARGNDGRRFPWGDQDPSPKLLNACGKECVAWGRAHGVDESAMYDADDGFAATSPVGSFPAGASPFGLLDVAGNVWEWTSDWYGPYRSDPVGDPKGATSGTERVVRGGAWNSAHVDWVRPTFRWHGAPATKSYAIGFRCAE